MVLEKTLESPLNYKEIKPVNPKGNQSCIFIGRTDAEAEVFQYFGHLMQRADSLGKTLMLGKTEGKRRRRQRRMRWLDSISRCEVRRDRQTSGEASASASLKNVGHEKVATELLSSKRQ